MSLVIMPLYFLACFSLLHDDWSGASMVSSHFLHWQLIMAHLFAAEPQAIQVHNTY